MIIQVNRLAALVFTAIVSLLTSSATALAADDTSSANQCSAGRVSGTQGDTLNVHKSPGYEADVIGRLQENEKVEVIGTKKVPLLWPNANDKEEYIWYHIGITGKSGKKYLGWVDSDYIECFDTVPVSGDDQLPSTTTATKFVRPVTNTEAKLSQVFGSPISYSSCGFHTGVDYGGELGDEIVAFSSGKVVYVGPLWMNGKSTGRGPFAIVIDHGKGLFSVYSHNQKSFVRAGQIIEAGEKIAEMGATGYASGPVLHFEVLKDAEFSGYWNVPFNDHCKKYTDPLSYLTEKK